MFTVQGKSDVKTWVCKDLSVLACKRLEIFVLKAQVKKKKKRERTLEKTAQNFAAAQTWNNPKLRGEV